MWAVPLTAQVFQTIHIQNSMLVDLLVECLAEGDDASIRVVTCRVVSLVVLEPEPHPVKKMETSSIDEMVAIWLVFGPEEDGGGEDAMEALHNPAVMAAVLGVPEEVQHMSDAFEMDHAAFLLDSECRCPDGNEAVLAEGGGRIQGGQRYRVRIGRSVAK